ncbi:MAG TPA: hypothetical protein VFO40_27360 [Chthoniobacterales bacterium]|nr:hypothetical protein [Chthoniobacterales bacterium]
MQHCLISGARSGVIVQDGRETRAQITLNLNRIQNCKNNGHAILLNGLHGDPNVAIGWNEITNQFGLSQPSDAINIYQSSGTPGRPILVHNNFV